MGQEGDTCLKKVILLHTEGTPTRGEKWVSPLGNVVVRLKREAVRVPPTERPDGGTLDPAALWGWLVIRKDSEDQRDLCGTLYLRGYREDGRKKTETQAQEG